MGVSPSEENEQRNALLSPTGSISDNATQTIELSPMTKCTIIVLVITASLLVGYFLGHPGLRDKDTSRFGLPSPPGHVQTIWQHNLTFTQKPSISSEAAWNSIVPIGRGFVHHIELAPFISNIAVFHQLHCLHAIIVAYYNALESPSIINSDDVPELDNSTSTQIAPFHVRHCFDYLRQALMCAADTNLENVDPKTHLTNGWDQVKQCRDYDQVVAWAEQFANSSDSGIVA
ncbi:hypothetical protein F5Y16DRAFT_402383 [Xylariaceae sp. FL0255]|nr:hypothetical protein F5Y16DRAFT_402383 [Xylariaceae sp. FL0255]